VALVAVFHQCFVDPVLTERDSLGITRNHRKSDQILIRSPGTM